MAIAVDAASVYWTNQADGTVMKCAKTGCNGHPTQLAAGQVSALDVDVTVNIEAAKSKKDIQGEVKKEKSR